MGFATVGFGGFEIMFNIVFILTLAMIVIFLVKGISTWNKNNQSPRLSVIAKVVAKRVGYIEHQHPNAGDATGAHGFYTTTSSVYYVSFQVESGDRMEFQVNGSEYGMLVEGDSGKLNFQGTRYLGFERED